VGYSRSIVRVVLTTVLGYAFAIPLPRLLGVAAMWGAAGLTTSAGIAGWVEMRLLRASLNARIGRTGLPAVFVARLWTAAATAAAAAWVVKLTIRLEQPIAVGLLVLGLYGVLFFALTLALGVTEASSMMRFLRRT
jgi:putative peptidoglycan lipid II flippase